MTHSIRSHRPAGARIACAAAVLVAWPPPPAATAASPGTDSHRPQVRVIGPERLGGPLAEAVTNLVRARADVSLTISSAVWTPPDFESGVTRDAPTIVIDAATPGQVRIWIPGPNGISATRVVTAETIDPITAETVAQIVDGAFRQMRQKGDGDGHADGDAGTTPEVGMKGAWAAVSPPPYPAPAPARTAATALGAAITAAPAPPVGTRDVEGNWGHELSASYLVRTLYADASFTAGRAPLEQGVSAAYAYGARTGRFRPFFQFALERTWVASAEVDSAGLRVPSGELDIWSTRVSAGLALVAVPWLELRSQIGTGGDRISSAASGVWVNGRRGALGAVIRPGASTTEIFANVTVDVRPSIRLQGSVANGGAALAPDFGVDYVRTRRLETGAAVGVAWRFGGR